MLEEVTNARARATQVQIPLDIVNNPEAFKRFQEAQQQLTGALGRLLAIAAAAIADGTWTRLKACRAEDCRWAFYDHARNR